MSKHPHPAQTSLFGQGDPATRRSLPGLAPQRQLGSPGPTDIETWKRDNALAQLEAYRSGLIEIARDIAIELARRRNRITSVEVFAEMRARGYHEAMDAVDPRWMGPVFREEIWERQGWEQTGSHRRPVAIWRLKDPRHVPPSPRQLVFDAIAARGDDGATDEEIALATSLTESSVKTAITDLLALDRIMPTATKRKRKSGRKAIVYVIPEHHPDIV